MRIRKNFSSISELEERAFCEGYLYAQREFAEKVEDEVWKRGKADAKDFWEGKNGFESKVGNRAVAIGVPAAAVFGNKAVAVGVPALAATAGYIYALRKKAAAANAAADELEAAAEED